MHEDAERNEAVPSNAFRSPLSVAESYAAPTLSGTPLSQVTKCCDQIKHTTKPENIPLVLKLAQFHNMHPQDCLVGVQRRVVA